MIFAHWKKNYDKPRQHIKKQRHHFLNKSPYSQSYIFPIVMYSCESWTIKKIEHQRIDALELWCWKRLESSLDSNIKLVNLKRNQPWILTHWKYWCWSWSSNTLATWCEQPTHWKRPWCWERLKAGEEGARGWAGWMASPMQRTWTWAKLDSEESWALKN